ncbi:MAG: shikimate kinase [Pyrinomonadaceae bacterium]|jgi:shikimate kinase|nr:shikimate kinase [Pyrinomonadaceae bacterium]
MNAHTPRRRIVLTGFMCAGKTTVARALAARLGCAAADTDARVVARAGRSIEAIIDSDGEARFRQLEHAALRDILESGDDTGARDSSDDTGACVIALGGGAWTIAENRALIAAHRCLTVWLDAPFELCWQRVTNSAADAARPLARDRERARELYDARRAAYARATLRVRVTEAQSAADTAAEIASIIEAENFSDEHEGREGENTHG